MKKEWAKITCVILWSHLHMITEVNRMWGKFGLLNYHAVIIFFPYLNVIPILSFLLSAFWVFDSNGTSNDI